MRLSVIIAFFNAEETLREQLEALAAQEWDQSWELLLADNGSTDESLAIAAGYQESIPHLRIVDASARRGPAFARNTGVAAASAEAVAFIDADDVAAPGWVAAVGNALQEHPAVASRFDYACLNNTEEQDYLTGNQATGLQRLWYPPYALHAGGCGLGVHKAVHEDIGGFNESLRRLSDTDYCLRIQQKGIELKFVPEALVYVRNRSDWQGAFYQGHGWAKYNTWLYKQYRGQERISQPWREYWGDWVRLGKRLLITGPTMRWVFRLGWQIGLLEGSICYGSKPAVRQSRKLPSTYQRAAQTEKLA